MSLGQAYRSPGRRAAAATTKAMSPASHRTPRTTFCTPREWRLPVAVSGIKDVKCRVKQLGSESSPGPLRLVQYPALRAVALVRQLLHPTRYGAQCMQDMRQDLVSVQLRPPLPGVWPARPAAARSRRNLMHRNTSTLRFRHIHAHFIRFTLHRPFTPRGTSMLPKPAGP